MSTIEQLHRYKDLLEAIVDSTKDFSSSTKAEIKSYGDSIGISLPNSLSKAKMIDKITSDDVFLEAEEERKRCEALEAYEEIYRLNS
ncbi:hypothetical protein N9M52_00170 [bacterium]|nr:hypothetical protein [bacterium]